MNILQLSYGIFAMLCGIVMFQNADSMASQLWGAGMNIVGILIVGIGFSESKQEK